MKLKNQQPNIILFIYRLLYPHGNHKLKIYNDKHTKIKRNPNTTAKLVIKSKRRKQNTKERKKTKASKITKLAIRTYILRITLNVNELNVPTKKHRLLNGLKN